jgi:hypothetical protein
MSTTTHNSEAPKNYLPSGETHKVENYPYGFKLKTDKFYSIEFKNKKGFRLVQQTMNPKTDKLNKPKKSTYSPVMLLVAAEDGKIKAHTEDFYGDDGIDRGLKFMADKFHNFLPEEIKSVAAHVVMVLKGDIYAKATYCGSDVKKLMPLYEEALATLVKIFKTGENLWSDISLDWEAIEALKVPDFNPFVKTTHTFKAS